MSLLAHLLCILLVEAWRPDGQTCLYPEPPVLVANTTTKESDTITCSLPDALSEAGSDLTPLAYTHLLFDQPSQQFLIGGAAYIQREREHTYFMNYVTWHNSKVPFEGEGDNRNTVPLWSETGDLL